MLFGLTDYLPEAVLTVGDNLEFLIRILVVELFGFLIGLERSKRQKDAGIRTHCIIAVTETLFFLILRTGLPRFSASVLCGLLPVHGERLRECSSTGCSIPS